MFLKRGCRCDEVMGICRCVESVMERVARGHAELMVASHNQASIEAALDNMRHMGVPADAPGTPISVAGDKIHHVAVLHDYSSCIAATHH